MRLSTQFVRVPASKLPAMAVALAFAGLITYQAYNFWQSQQEAPVASITRTSTQTQTRNTPNIGQLAASHLFGKFEVAAPQFTEVKEDKSLHLTLRGIVANPDGKNSLAIIESGPNKEDTFAVGENVYNKGKLNFVAADHVILARTDGQLAKLQLPEQDTGGFINEEFLPLAQPDTEAQEAPVPDQSVEAEPASSAALPDEQMTLPADDGGMQTDPASTDTQGIQQ